MRKILLPLVIALAATSPALANEARVEARGGVLWGGGDTDATAGVAAGYDADLGPGAFVGGEVSGDKILASNTRIMFGFTGRLGIKTLAGKFFGAAGHTTKPCEFCVSSEHLGAGYEHGFGPLYGKVEYRHYFTHNGAPDANAVMAGVGLKF